MKPLASFTRLAGPLLLAAAIASCSNPSARNVILPEGQELERTIEAYSLALLEIEPYRQSAYERVREAAGDERAEDLRCDREATVRKLPRTVRDTAVEYCANAKAIVEANQLSVGEFNAISEQLQTDAELRRQVSATLARVQQQPPASEPAEAAPESPQEESQSGN